MSCHRDETQENRPLPGHFSKPNDSSTLTTTDSNMARVPSTGLEESSGARDGTDGSPTQELSQVEIERLGRQRPEALSSTVVEVGFVGSLLASMIMAEFFISGFNIILPELALLLDIPEASRTWPAGVFALTTGAFLLPFARLGDMYGGYVIFNGGMAWFLVWSLVAAFSRDYMMLIICRALQGLGPAAFLPSSIMMLGSTYRPGPRKNLVFSLYGACAPLGFFFGIFIAGLAGQYLSWRWYFWIGTIILALIVATSLWCMPRDYQEHKSSEVRMDWLGASLIVPGLLLVVYAFTDAGHAPQGFRTSYILVTFIVGMLLLGVAVYVEGWVAKEPLLPPEIFAVKHMKLMACMLFLTYGVFGIFLFYSSFYIKLIMGVPALQAAAWFAPMAVGGIILSTVGGLLLHLLPGRLLLLISGSGHVLCTLLFALIPLDAGTGKDYWAFIFPAMIGATVAIDITYNVSNIFITTNLPRSRQGQAGALINSLLFLGISFFLGLADLAVAGTRYLGEAQSYKVAFWMALGFAALVMIGFLFLDIGAAKSELTAEERERQKGNSADNSSVIPDATGESSRDQSISA